jgi:hypothetical protein
MGLRSKPDRIIETSGAVIVTVSARAGHSEQVFEWRKDQFRRIGYNVARAEFLADSHIDLAKARTMRANGCSLELLEEILLGTCFAGEDDRWYRTPELVYEEEADDGA